MKGDGFGFGFGAASFFTAESRSSRREGSVQARTAQVGSAMRRPGVGLASGSSSQVSRPHVLRTLRRRWAGSASAWEEGELRAEVRSTVVSSEPGMYVCYAPGSALCRRVAWAAHLPDLPALLCAVRDP